MADDGYLYLLFVAEVVVIVHLPRHEGIGPCPDGIAQEESPCSPTDGDAPDGALQQLVGHDAGHVELTFQQRHEVLRLHTLLQLAYHAAAAHDVAHQLLRTEEAHVLQPHPLGYLEVDATRRIVRIGVHRDHRDVVLDGLHHGALHIVVVADALQGVEDERMMAHDEVAAEGYCLVHYAFCDV